MYFKQAVYEVDFENNVCFKMWDECSELLQIRRKFLFLNCNGRYYEFEIRVLKKIYRNSKLLQSALAVIYDF